MSNYQKKSLKTLSKNSTCRKNVVNPSSSIMCKNKLQAHSHSSCPSANQVQAVKVTASIGSSGDKIVRKYNAPQLNSVLREVNQIENIEAMRPPLFKQDIDLTPRSKAIIAPKVTQRLNFNTDQVVFKNLTPINVNDSILIQKHNACPNKYKKLNKVPSPELYHWLEPLPALKHTIDEPEITLEFCEEELDPFQSYLRLLN
ncbi:protein PPP1R35 homolog [Anastrepha obliqua]|uniref:protein PPP1R35 homolog n=1 Tax=Anastrepha obliqua TaxID=95512 RepID=UPI002408F9A5|nr:protein PPP1R35 homolog [Anastrepha obliqua]